VGKDQPQRGEGTLSRINGVGLLNLQENAVLKNETAFFCLQSENRQPTNLRRSRLYLAGRRTAVKSIQAVLPTVFYTFDEFFVTCVHAIFFGLVVIFICHDVFLHIYILVALISGLDG
jgi:hypothetical protein